MIDAESFWDILIDEMAVELPCTTQDCTLGPGGAAFKTPALDIDSALRVLDRHLLSHGIQGAGGGGGAAGGGKKIQLSKIQRPTITGGCSQEEFQFFKRAWNQYIRASNETSDVAIRDQLLHCPDDALKRAVARSLGNRVDTINVVDLLMEIETLAVVKQSNLVNTLALMSAKQERGEPVRQFAARLRGLAAICDLTIQYTCQCTIQHKVSYVDKWVLMTLVGGLYDEDTKQAVLSKVDEMPLADTIIFVEARETGKQSLKVLSGGLSSGQVHRVHEEHSQQDQGLCRCCGKKGHGENPSRDLKKASCPAFNHRCKKCGKLGHFKELCKAKPKPKPKPEEDKKT